MSSSGLNRIIADIRSSSANIEVINYITLDLSVYTGLLKVADRKTIFNLDIEAYSNPVSANVISAYICSIINRYNEFVTRFDILVYIITDSDYLESVINRTFFIGLNQCYCSIVLMIGSISFNIISYLMVVARTEILYIPFVLACCKIKIALKLIRDGYLLGIRCHICKNVVCEHFIEVDI